MLIFVSANLFRFFLKKICFFDCCLCLSDFFIENLSERQYHKYCFSSLFLKKVEDFLLKFRISVFILYVIVLADVRSEGEGVPPLTILVKSVIN